MQFISLILLLILNIYNNAFIVHTLGINTEQFDWNLTKEILKNEGNVQNNRNAILSPYLTKLSLSSLKETIAQESESQNELLFFPSRLNKLDKYFDAIYFEKTIESLKEKNENNYVLMGSLIGLPNNTIVYDFYNYVAEHLFNTEIQNYDFDRTNETVQILNDYVLTKSEGHVKDTVTPDLINGSQIIILNTMYFKAEWEKRFETTINGQFSVDNNEHIQTTFMQTFYYNDYTESETLDSQLIRMDYRGGKYAMYIVLPNKVDGLQNVINNLDPNILENETSKMKATYMNLTIPKFKFESSFNLAKHLQNLGIKKIFTPEANFYLFNSSEPELKVKDVVQKMGIEVNEVGTGAYGSVGMGIRNKRLYSLLNLNKVKLIDVTVGHSFLFFIKDVTTDTVISTGKVMNPEYSN